MGLLAVLAVPVLVVIVLLGVRALARRPRREQVGFIAGLAVYVLVNLLLHRLGDDRQPAWQLGVALVTVAVAVDLALQVTRLRPAPRQVALAIVGWGLGSVLLTSVVVAVYVARRVMTLPVIGRPRRQPVSSARS